MDDRRVLCKVWRRGNQCAFIINRALGPLLHGAATDIEFVPDRRIFSVDVARLTGSVPVHLLVMSNGHRVCLQVSFCLVDETSEEHP